MGGSSGGSGGGSGSPGGSGKRFLGCLVEEKSTVS